MQNNVKYTAKCYHLQRLRWYNNTTTPPGSDNAGAFNYGFKMSDFLSSNLQFIKNMDEYHYVKFNYFAIKLTELSYLGYTGPVKYDGNFVAEGVNALQFNDFPFYLCWDLEEDLKFGGVEGDVDISIISQYPFTKKKTPKSKSISFVWHVPAPWKQYLSTYNVKNVKFDTTIENFFEGVTNYKNIRCPSKLVGGHYPFWDDDISGKTSPTAADPNTYVWGQTICGFQFYCNVTFRGRKVMGNVK